MTFIPQLQNLLSIANSTETPLPSSSTYTGTEESVTLYSTVSVTVYSDTRSADNGLIIQFSNDGTHWDTEFTFTILADSAQHHTIPVAGVLFRVIYQNSDTAQSEFRLQTIYNVSKTPSSMTSNLDTNKGMINYKNVNIIGQSNERKDAGHQPVKVSNGGSLSVDITSPASFYNGVITTSYDFVAIITFRYNINPAIVRISTSGSGNVNHDTPFAILSTGTTQGSRSLIRSINEMNYLPGVGINIKFTAVFTSGGKPGTRQIIGYGTESSGVFFGYQNEQFGVFRRTNNIDTFIPQSEWNNDKFDGTGASKQIFNPQNGNLFKIIFTWYGFGKIIYYMENNFTGRFVKVHEITFNNLSPNVSLSNPNGSLRADVTNTSSTENVEMQTASMSMSYESKAPRTLGARFSTASTDITTTADVQQTVLNIRAKELFQGIENSVPVGMTMLSIATFGNRRVIIRIIKNATQTLNVEGIIWTDVSSNESTIEVNKETYDVVDGQELQAFYISRDDSKIIDLMPLKLDISPGDSLSFTAETSDNTNSTSVSISWIERF